MHIIKVFATGDTHIPFTIHNLTTKLFPEQKELTKEDFLIICGDFGLLWDVDGWSNEELYWKKWLEDKPWTTLLLMEITRTLTDSMLIRSRYGTTGRYTRSLTA